MSKLTTATKNGKIFKKSLKELVIKSGYAEVKKSDLNNVLNNPSVYKFFFIGFSYKNSHGATSNNGFVLVNRLNNTLTFVHGQSQKVGGTAIDKVEGQIHNLSNMVLFNNLTLLDHMNKKALYVIDGAKAIEEIAYVEQSAKERTKLDGVRIEVCKLSDLNNYI